MKFVRLALVLALSLAVASQALAVYIPGGSAVKFKFTNWDVGTIYDTSGYDNGTYEADDLDVLYGATAANDWEDGWGIFRLTEITDPTGEIYYWSASSSSTEITGIFWDITDEVVILADGTQTILSSGIKFAFYEDGAKNWNRSNPSTRSSDSEYYLPFFSTVTDGTLIWTGYGVAGGVEVNGTVSDDYTFYTSYTVATKSAEGGFFGTLGTVSYETDSGTQYLTGADNDQFTLWDPDGNGYYTTFEFAFTGEDATKSDPNTQWLLKSEDPVNGRVTPELPASALLALGLLPMGLAWLRRKS